MGWRFERVLPMGGATGEAYSNVLHGSGMEPTSVLAREAIQNSVDAELGGSGKVRVVFRRVELLGELKHEFCKMLCLGDMQSLRQELDLRPGNGLDRLDDLGSPLELLFVEDYGTHGLYGDPHTPGSHFHRLLLSLGDGSKVREFESSGGSYGYGKAVYSGNSLSHLIVAYSVFEPELDDEGHIGRLLGCAYFKNFQCKNEFYTGRAWFGDSSRGDDHRTFPYEDDSAHELAAKIGFRVRERDETGTSILIVDTRTDVDELRRSIEDWWWPRILEDDLDVELWDNGNPVEPPRPRLRADLQPFIHCFDMAIGKSVPAGPSDKANALNRLRGTNLGRYGFTLLDTDSLDNEQNAWSDCVALIRGPRMVVSYSPVRNLPLPCVGVFVADRDIEAPLRFSEPPAHDRWDSSSARLNDDSEREIVAAVTKRLADGLRRFSREASPESPEIGPRLEHLERMLGILFTSPEKGPGGGHPAAPIEIHFEREPTRTFEGSLVRMEGAFSIALAERAERETINAAIEVQCLPVEDDQIARDDPIPVTIYSGNPNHEQCQDRRGLDQLLVRLEKGSRRWFTFMTGLYPVDWTASLSVSVREVQ